jgi:hypothetical protein
MQFNFFQKNFILCNIIWQNMYVIQKNALFVYKNVNLFLKLHDN